jgi:probable HAF family extracellular repeat protein
MLPRPTPAPRAEPSSSTVTTHSTEEPMRRTSCTLLTIVLGACSDQLPPTRPGGLAPEAALIANAPRYDVTIIRSKLGGTQTRGNGISNRGLIAGWSNLADGTRHAALWIGESIEDLETLGGPSSTVPWPGINNNGMVVGLSHTAELDSLAEQWSCEAGSFLPATNPRRVCRGFVWMDGSMHPLPTFGGTHGFATGVNNVGQVVGWAETTVFDPTCNAASGTGLQKLQFRAAMWNPQKGTMAELPPYPGDSTSAATAINERGQVVGISGECDQAVGRFSARRSVIWERGNVDTLPTLGGTSWHTPMDINERGDVVGFSNPPGAGDLVGDFIANGFFWAKGSATVERIKPLEGNTNSQAMGVNDRRQVVGVSFGGAPGLRAFLWQDGVLWNLNDLASIKPNVLLSAQHINDAGQITGRVQVAATGEVLAFVATPRP